MKTTDSKNSSSCYDDSDPQSLSLDEACAKILASIQTIDESELLDLPEALDRISAADIQSQLNIPLHDNSAMDGYAVRYSDLQEAKTELTIAGKSLAGHPYAGTLQPGQCVRITTGGVMPDGSDSVIVQEQAEISDDTIQVGSGHKLGQNVRYAGEDIEQGSTIIERGTRLTPSHLGLLASVGVGQVACLRPLKACIFSTGDELKSIGTLLQKGDLYDSNRYTLSGMLRRLHVEVTDLGVIKDNRADLKEAFRTASQGYDVVITSGGVSVGEADFTKEIFTQIGDIDFWKVAVKPGRPVAFGKLGTAAYFGLPGNPVSIVVSFYMLVHPALRKMLSIRDAEPLIIRAQCTKPLRKRAGRAEVQRGMMCFDHDGQAYVQSTGPQGSGILSSVTQANCFICLAEDTESVEAGEYVTVMPFAGLA